MHQPIQPIDNCQQAHVRQQTRLWLQQAEDKYCVKLPEVDIDFSLRGRSAGMFCVRRGQCQIRYNPYIFAKYYEDNCRDTIPHEVAHLVTYRLHGRIGVKPHGAQWRAIMQDFGRPAVATCQYDLSGIPQRKMKRFNYQCACQKHALTAYRHNQIVQKRKQYLCRQCQQTLIEA